MTPMGGRVFRDTHSSDEIERLYPALTVRIDYGELTISDRLRINAEIGRLDSEHRGGGFNGLEYFHFRFSEQATLMTMFLLQEGLHRLVPGSMTSPTPQQVEAEWRRRAAERRRVMAWAREKRLLSEIILAYRFERHRGAPSYRAHEAAAKVVARLDPTVADPKTDAGLCIEWAEREHRDWFWRCAPDHPFL